jgi:hypothetical protein
MAMPSRPLSALKATSVTGPSPWTTLPPQIVAGTAAPLSILVCRPSACRSRS